MRASVFAPCVSFAGGPGAHETQDLLDTRIQTFLPGCLQKGRKQERKAWSCLFDSGMAQMEALPAKQWVLGGTGGVPQVVGSLRYGAYQIGLGDDESVTNNVYVRADSPILKVKGFNKDYPEVYGSPETVKGKTILVTTVSSVHYAMSTWLKVLGLKDSDVVVKQMDQASAMAAFEKGVGDVAVLWAPYCYTAEAKGKVSTRYAKQLPSP
jgi:ABC-type nitrate/sulfonate/bicarbonate transport system substrate-binding protein